jgi:Fibronectin type III domain
MQLAWEPPEVHLPAYADLVTHYRVTISPFDDNWALMPGKTFQVDRLQTSIRFSDLYPFTAYNISIEAGTKTCMGELLWTVYSTLPPPGKCHVLDRPVATGDESG